MRAFITVRLAKTLAAELMPKIEKITFSSDSTSVLHWIHQTSSNYKAFVGNRVSEIHTIISNLETALGAGAVSWRYVPSGDNPVDDITRGLHSVELNLNHCYSVGPVFLYIQPSSGQKTKLKCSWKKTREKGKD